MHPDCTIERLRDLGIPPKPKSGPLRARRVRARTGTEGVLRVARNELLRISARHLTLQERERRRIAADLHDGLGQSLSLLKMSIDRIAGLLSAGETESAAECLNRLKCKVEDATEELRRIAMNLRPAMLDSLGILDTLSWYLRELKASCPNATIEPDLRVDEADVPRSLRTPIFRIVQEASSNAIRHAGADRIRVGLARRLGALELTIGDNGRGFDPAAQVRRDASNAGLGLRSMKERAELSRGIYELKSAPGSGTEIRVAWPRSPKDAVADRAAGSAPRVRSLREPKPVDPERPEGAAMLRERSASAACLGGVDSHG